MQMHAVKSAAAVPTHCTGSAVFTRQPEAVTAVAAAQSTALQQHNHIDCAQVAGPALFGALGIQPRDLRLLDWKHAAMYPSALLCRDCALLAALEHIKCIITRDSVLVMGGHFLLGLSGTVITYLNCTELYWTELRQLLESVPKANITNI